MTEYTNADALVDIDWLEGKIDDPGVRIIERSEPPSAGPPSHPWRKLAIVSMITGGTGLIVVMVAKLLLFVRRLARRMKELAESIGIVADHARRKR